MKGRKSSAPQCTAGWRKKFLLLILASGEAQRKGVHTDEESQGWFTAGTKIKKAECQRRESDQFSPDVTREIVSYSIPFGKRSIGVPGVEKFLQSKK